MIIERHKTAIGRAEFSKPVRLALENQLLCPADRFFDYGCGRGTDVKLLRGLQYEAHWPGSRLHSTKERIEISRYPSTVVMS